MTKKKGVVREKNQKPQNIEKRKGFIENINKIKTSDFAHVKLMTHDYFCTFFHVQVEKEQYVLSINCNCLPYRCP